MTTTPRSLLAIAIVLAAIVPATATAAPTAGDGFVTRVTDGDSLWIEVGRKPPLEVRLRDIDAPEICQDGGDDARRALADLALGQRVVLRSDGVDRYGRTLGAVSVGGVDVATRLVEEGHAWSIRTRWDRGPLVRQERMAAALRRGLHAQPGAMMPAEFRRVHGPCHGAASPPVAAHPGRPLPPRSTAIDPRPHPVTAATAERAARR